MQSNVCCCSCSAKCHVNVKAINLCAIFAKAANNGYNSGMRRRQRARGMGTLKRGSVGSATYAKLGISTCKMQEALAIVNKAKTVGMHALQNATEGIV